MRAASRADWLLVLATSLAAASGTLAWQQPAPGANVAPAGTGSILGVVVEAGANRPVRGAVVTLTGREGLAAFRIDVLADAEGRFAFLDLPKGSFNLSADKPGYSFGDYGKRRIGGRPQPLSLADGEHATGITIPIWKYAAISGIVVDEMNEPVAGLGVQALPCEYVGGRPMIFTSASVSRTDDRGVYRLSRLTPGDYVIVAAIRQLSIPEPSGSPGSATPDPRSNAMSGELMVGGSTDSRPGTPETLPLGGVLALIGPITPPPPRSDGTWSVYETAFYPATATTADAKPVTVQSGEERLNIDFQLRPIATRRVSGVVRSAEGPVGSVGLRLVPPGAQNVVSDMETAVAFSDSNGRFVFPAVPQGSYTLKALDVPSEGNGFGMVGGANGDVRSLTLTVSPWSDRPTLWAAQPVSVGADNITDLAVTLQRGARIRGRVVFDRQGAATSPRVSVQTDPADGRRLSSTSFAVAAVNANNEFQTIELPPGRYFVNIVPPAPSSGWTFAGAIREGHDLSYEPLELGTANIEDVVITVTDHSSELKGTVRNAQNRTDADASVLIFPTDSRAWVDFGRSPRRLLDARAGVDGSFVFRGLPSGDYFVVAVPDERARNWRTPASLDALSRAAVRIHVNDTESKVQDLKTSQIR
jgi:hypothetical protein